MNSSLPVIAGLTLFATLGWGADSPSDLLFKQHAIAWSQQPLADGLAELSRTTKLAIWLDRRVDPSLPVEIQVADVAYRMVEKIAESVNLRAVVVPSMIVVAHPEHADRIASSILATRELASANRNFLGLTKLLEFKWPLLATPQQIALHAEKTWNTKVDREPLPHDLWRETKFERIDGATVLALIGSGFELAPKIRGTSIVWSALPQRIAVSKRYTNLKGQADLEKRALTIDPQAVWNVDRRGVVDLTATAAAHQLVTLSLATPPSGTTAPERRTKLNVINKPATDVLLALATNEKWEIDWSPETLAKAKVKLINLQREASSEVLIAEVCQQAGLTWKRIDRKLVIETAN